MRRPRPERRRRPRGSAFWPFHDALFARQGTWAELGAAEADAAFEAIATEIGIDAARWRADAATADTAEAVDVDRRSAERMGLPERRRSSSTASSTAGD